jgi:serine/threonine protein kinase
MARRSARAGARPSVGGSDPLGVGAGRWGDGGAGVALADGGSSEFGVGLDPTGWSTYGLGPDESGEVCIDPIAPAGSRASAWGVASRSSSGVASASAPSVAVGSGEAGTLGRFRILGELGQGQHATVYRAYDALLDRDVALKVPRPGVLRTERALERFLGEARAQARLRHPRIVPVYEAGRAGDRHYLAMALIEGLGLDERLAEDGPMPPDQAARVAAELAEALAYAHGLGVVHRDVKPANVRVDDRGDVYLMDFGIAYRPDSNELPLPPGMILGTPAYVAPEQAEGGHADPLPASDQYSLGALFYELLCGRPPFVGPPSYVLFHAIHRDPPSPRAVEPRVPRALAAICLKALAKDPRRRYADCQALADDLRRWLHGENPLAHRRGWGRLGR